METKKCSTLEEARGAIDKVDEEIVKLIAQRNDYIKQIAHFKTSVDEVKAEDRIDDERGPQCHPDIGERP